MNWHEVDKVTCAGSVDNLNRFFQAGRGRGPTWCPAQTGPRRGDGGSDDFVPLIVLQLLRHCDHQGRYHFLAKQQRSRYTNESNTANRGRSSSHADDCNNHISRSGGSGSGMGVGASS